MGQRLVQRRPELPVFLQRRGNDEFVPPAHSEADLRVMYRVRAEGLEAAHRLATPVGEYWASRMGTAAALRTLDQASGGGFYQVPDEAPMDRDAADAALGGRQMVIDVQTHYIVDEVAGASLNRGLLTTYMKLMPEGFSGLDGMVAYTMAEYMRCVFLDTETTVAVLSSAPLQGDLMLSNAEMAGTRELFDRLAGTGRLLNHTVVQPTVPGELDRMERWKERYHPAAWKVYTRPAWGAEGQVEGPGWTLDDEHAGFPFLQRCLDLGVRNVCTHKGLSILFSATVPDAVRTLSPRDIGPAAAAFPDINFLVYHSGYEPELQGYQEEGPYSQEVAHLGSNRLVKSLADAGIGPGSNVYAELGTTWFCLVKRPREAAHVLGKLLLAVGEDNVIWGTDSIWYGPPQPFLDAFRAFQIPEELREKYGYPEITPAIKEKVLGLNSARIYGIDVGQARANAQSGELAWARTVLQEHAVKGLPAIA